MLMYIYIRVFKRRRNSRARGRKLVIADCRSGPDTFRAPTGFTRSLGSRYTGVLAAGRWRWPIAEGEDPAIRFVAVAAVSIGERATDKALGRGSLCVLSSLGRADGHCRAADPIDNTAEPLLNAHGAEDSPNQATITAYHLSSLSPAASYFTSSLELYCHYRRRTIYPCAHRARLPPFSRRRPLQSSSPLYSHIRSSARALSPRLFASGALSHKDTQ